MKNHAKLKTYWCFRKNTNYIYQWFPISHPTTARPRQYPSSIARLQPPSLPPRQARKVTHEDQCNVLFTLTIIRSTNADKTQGNRPEHNDLDIFFASRPPALSPNRKNIIRFEVHGLVRKDHYRHNRKHRKNILDYLRSTGTPKDENASFPSRPHNNSRLRFDNSDTFLLFTSTASYSSEMSYASESTQYNQC